MQTIDHTSATGDETSPAKRLLVRVSLITLVSVFAAFWVWALFFASKEAVNKLDDQGVWATRAEQICAQAADDRFELTDLRSVVDVGPELIRERADIVDHATDILEQMVDDLVAVQPTDEKGQAIVPLWDADYRIYLQDRRNYADQLRETGENLAFYETKVDAIPISERIATFAGDNEMPSCAPPYDLTR